MVPKILLGVTGSVAAVLTGKLVKALREVGEVRVVFTDKGQWFVNKNEKAEAEFIEAFPAWERGPASGVFTESDEWPSMYNKNDPVQHIELRDWADVLVVAPLTANTMAKIRYGLCDNLLTSVIRAWEPHKPLVAAPAMNTKMWEHPHTEEQLDWMTSLGQDWLIVDPQEKVLACGDKGMGAMAPIEKIVESVQHVLKTGRSE